MPQNLKGSSLVTVEDTKVRFNPEVESLLTKELSTASLKFQKGLLEKMRPLEADLMQAVNDNFDDLVMK